MIYLIADVAGKSLYSTFLAGNGTVKIAALWVYNENTAPFIPKN